MSTEEVKVFGNWSSPFSWRVQMGLKMKGVSYEYIEEDLNNKSPSLLKYNPFNNKVPVLVHNGKAIVESLIILEYIDETWPEGPSILPKDPYERAMARFTANVIDKKYMPAAWKLSTSVGEEQEKAKEEVLELEKFLDNELKGKKFFGGHTIGFVDLAASFIAHWSWIVAKLQGFIGVTATEFPNLCEWIEEFVNYGIVKENLPPQEKLAELFKGYLHSDHQDGSKFRPSF